MFSFSVRGSRAHPRSRGEHWYFPSWHAAMWGSSPLARGAHGKRYELREVAGLIPARAGSTACPTRTFLCSGAHPRSRGEHSLTCCPIWAQMGSSPLARGARLRYRRVRRGRRLIPARAGSTVHALPPLDSQTAHPRSRGEHRGRSLQAAAAVGSSPLARGARMVCPFLSCLYRLIPARAGSTRKRA